MLKCITSVLEEDITADIQNRCGAEAADRQIRERGKEAKQIKGILCCQSTLLELAGLCDIYNLLGNIANVSQVKYKFIHKLYKPVLFQQFRDLPHERLDAFDKAMEKMDGQASHIEDQQCDGDSCDLKFYHKARASLKADSSIEGIFVHDKYPARAAALLSRTRASQRFEDTGDESADCGEECVIGGPEPSIHIQSDKKLKFLSSELSKDLKARVVDDWERELIEKTRAIVDIKNIMTEMKQMKMSPAVYSENSFPKFREAVDFLEIPGLELIADSVLKSQYKDYIRILSSLTQSVCDEECVIPDTKQIISRLFSSKEKLYEDIQIVNHIISVAATKSTTESVIESFVSQYEYGNNSRRNYVEDGICDTFEIQKDGPLVSKCDNLVRTALDNYFGDKKRKGWHFVMNDNEKLFKTSKVLSKIDQKQSDLPFME